MEVFSGPKYPKLAKIQLWPRNVENWRKRDKFWCFFFFYSIFGVCTGSGSATNTKIHILIGFYTKLINYKNTHNFEWQMGLWPPFDKFSQNLTIGLTKICQKSAKWPIFAQLIFTAVFVLKSQKRVIHKRHSFQINGKMPRSFHKNTSLTRSR